MGRWEPNARDRLARAAVELFGEQGFAETTVPQITQRAGLTTRTFYRHFADKREALFAVEGEFPRVVAHVLDDIPVEMAPMPAIERAAHIVAETRFVGLQDYLRVRRSIVDSDQSLRERELQKYEALADEVARQFGQRGLDGISSALTARIFVTALTLSLDRWLDQDGDRPPLGELVNDTFSALRVITAPESIGP